MPLCVSITFYYPELPGLFEIHSKSKYKVERASWPKDTDAVSS